MIYVNMAVREIEFEAVKVFREEDYPGQRNEYVREKIIQLVVQTADAILMEGSDGSVEETDYLTSAVAQAFVNKVHIANTSRLLRHQLMGQIGEQTTQSGRLPSTGEGQRGSPETEHSPEP